MAYTFDSDIVSDLHKDARGFRPREGFWNHWNLSTYDEKQEIWDALLRELKQTMDEEHAREAQAVADFEARVSANLQLGAADRATAVRWLVEGLGLDEYDLRYGGDYVCFELGLPYSMKNEFDGICRELINEMKEPNVTS